MYQKILEIARESLLWVLFNNRSSIEQNIDVVWLTIVIDQIATIIEEVNQMRDRSSKNVRI
jgi:hypothetical protein